MESHTSQGSDVGATRDLLPYIGGIHSLAPAVARYIRDQERHHRRMTFQEELIAFLKKNRIAYDERYLWS
jgi:hypothetical protein